MKQRDVAIDILKGIGIVLVLTAHSLEGFVSQFAYTFHMPLFFIVTGLFISIYCGSEGDSFTEWWRERAGKDAKRLLYPALFTMAVILAVSCLWYIKKDSYLQNPVTLIWNDAPQGKLNYVNMLGNLWFLFALFFAKQFFYVLRYLMDGWLLPVICLAFGLTAVFIRQWYELPFEVLGGFSVLPFIWVGYWLILRNREEEKRKNKEVVPRWLYVTIPFWVSFIFWGKGRLGAMPLTYFLPYIISACGGTLFFYHVSNAIKMKTRYLSRCLAFLGGYSLILICAPSIETYCFPMQEILPDMPCRNFFIIICKVGWCTLALYACIKVPFLKTIFGVK